MPRFLRSFLFPDVNVWTALTYGEHVHHPIAKVWFEQLDMEARVCFCRVTQLSLLRLLTTEAVMGTDEVMTQGQAWQAYDRWLGVAASSSLMNPQAWIALFACFLTSAIRTRKHGRIPTLRPSHQPQICN